MRYFLVDATLKDKIIVRLLLVDEHGKKLVLDCEGFKRVIYIVPNEELTSEWIEHTILYLQRYSGGKSTDFSHSLVTKRHMLPNNKLSSPILMLRVECASSLNFSLNRNDRITRIYGLYTSLLEHVLVEHQLRGWLYVRLDDPSVQWKHKRVAAISCISSIVSRCTDQSSLPPLTTVAVYRTDTVTYSLSVCKGVCYDYLSVEDLRAHLHEIDPVVICVHDKSTLIGIPILFPFVLIDTAVFAREFKLSYTKDLDDAVPRPVYQPIVADTFECFDDEAPIGDPIDPIIRSGTERCGAIFSIVDRVNAIDLTLEIAAITGQPWSQTLNLSSKLGRVEWMIMNHFHVSDCVVPDPRKYTTPERYTAGLVLDAQIGIHHNVALLDFRSLYPSIVVEYGLCWSENGSVLPKTLEYLIDFRRDLEHVPGMETKRLCLKLLANTMYGALAFPAFRFYSPTIATEITRLGREALMRVASIVENEFDARVIYGDTDSVFVTSGCPSIDSLARSILARVNANYKKLELEFEATYEELLLFGKKCYVAYKANYSKPILKGVMMIKKQYHGAGKELCKYVLERLRGKKDATFEDIYRATEELVERFQNNKVKRSELTIVNMLSKRLCDYEVAPYHVTAARASRLAYDRGDYVRYIMFEGPTPIVLEQIDELDPIPVDVRWYCAQIFAMLEQLLRIFPQYSGDRFSSLLLNNVKTDKLSWNSAFDVDDIPDAKNYAPEPRPLLNVNCLICQKDIEHCGLSKLEQYLFDHPCKGGVHLSIKTVFPKHPLSASTFLECQECACMLNFSYAIQQVEDEFLLAGYHTNYDCCRLISQLKCVRCQDNLMTFFVTQKIFDKYEAIRRDIYLRIS